MNESQAISAFAALAQETRLRILRFLVTRGEEGATAGEIGAEVGAISSRASFHLSTLAQAGIVGSEKRSRQVIYRANFENMAALVAYLVRDCCKNDARVAACCSPLGSVK